MRQSGFIISPDGKTESLKSGGSPLGSPDVVFASSSRELKNGECLCLYTDGVFEFTTRNGMKFGIRRFQKLVAEVVKSKPGAGAQEIRDQIALELKKQQTDSAQEDDISFVLLKCN